MSVYSRFGPSFPIKFHNFQRSNGGRRSLTQTLCGNLSWPNLQKIMDCTKLYGPMVSRSLWVHFQFTMIHAFPAQVVVDAAYKSFTESRREPNSPNLGWVSSLVAFSTEVKMMRITRRCRKCGNGSSSRWDQAFNCERFKTSKVFFGWVWQFFWKGFRKRRNASIIIHFFAVQNLGVWDPWFGQRRQAMAWWVQLRPNIRQEVMESRLEVEHDVPQIWGPHVQSIWWFPEVNHFEFEWTKSLISGRCHSPFRRQNIQNFTLLYLP